MAESLEDVRAHVSNMLLKARAMHRAGNEAAAADMRRTARAAAFDGVAAAQHLRDAFAEMAAETVVQHGQDAAWLVSARLDGEAA